MLSLYLGPKVITINSFYCISQKIWITTNIYRNNCDVARVVGDIEANSNFLFSNNFELIEWQLWERNKTLQKIETKLFQNILLGQLEKAHW